jgi:catechol 2,3-dioxygenase-like lactoylglutathione lyase family enzyme
MRLDHCVIAVSDRERSNAFYRDVLGAELIEGKEMKDPVQAGPRDGGRPPDPNISVFHYRFGDNQLNVHGPGLDPHPVAREPVRPGNSDLCFEWDGPIEGAVEHLGEHGVEIEEGPVTRGGARGRGTSVYFRDPDGTLLEFISYA